MSLPAWNEPARIVPSKAYVGESDKDVIHLAVGRALNEWENLEQVLSFIFRHLVESKSPAASHAYGRLVAGTARREALEAATWAFFRDRGDPAMVDFDDLYKAYGNVAKYRNNIAHGICLARLEIGGRSSFHSGWFLFPPQYNSRRRSTATPDGASYIYKEADIDHCRGRFIQVTAEANKLEGYLRRYYPLQ